MSRQRHPRDPWKDAPVSELQDQVLPRWFVLTAAVMVVLAVATVVAAFLVFGPREVPVAERRPPPAGGLTNDVGAFEAGDLEPMPYEDACPLLQGIRVAGTEADRAILRRGLAALCNTQLDGDARERLEAFAAAGGVVRFAAFQHTGVDSTSTLADPNADPIIYVNARFTSTSPLWIAPLVAHDTTFVDRDPALAESALEARRTEAQVCQRLLRDDERSRGCRDAAELLALPDPLDALGDAGFR